MLWKRAQALYMLDNKSRTIEMKRLKFFMTMTTTYLDDTGWKTFLWIILPLQLG